MTQYSQYPAAGGEERIFQPGGGRRSKGNNICGERDGKDYTAPARKRGTIERGWLNDGQGDRWRDKDMNGEIDRGLDKQTDVKLGMYVD